MMTENKIKPLMIITIKMMITIDMRDDDDDDDDDDVYDE